MWHCSGALFWTETEKEVFRILITKKRRREMQRERERDGDTNWFREEQSESDNGTERERGTRRNVSAPSASDLWKFMDVSAPDRRPLETLGMS